MHIVEGTSALTQPTPAERLCVVEFRGREGKGILKLFPLQGTPISGWQWETEHGTAMVFKVPRGRNPYPPAMMAEWQFGDNNGIWIHDATSETLKGKRELPALLPEEFLLSPKEELRLLIQKDRPAPIANKGDREFNSTSLATTTIPNNTRDTETSIVMNGQNGAEEATSIVMHSTQVRSISNKKDKDSKCITMEVDGDYLRSAYSDHQNSVVMAHYMGFPVEGIKEPSQCILPGHSDHEAALYRGENGVYVYTCFAGGRIYTLPNVRASIAYRQTKECNKVESAVWGIRLLVESGLLSPATVNAPELRNATDTLRQVYNGFLFLLACKWLYKGGSGAPTVFSWPFAMAWCGVTEAQAKGAITSLKGRGYIVEAAKYEGRYKRSVTLWLPGTEELVAERLAAWKAKRS